MDVNLPLNYFLVDDGEINGGIFLASAYQHLIISKNNKNGILHSYISHLEEQTSVQEATKDEIINIDDQTFKSLEVLISKSSIRNTFSKDKNNNIIFKNDNDIIYNFEYIEEELGKIILPGLKKFKPEKIRFVTHSYEAFLG